MEINNNSNGLEKIVDSFTRSEFIAGVKNYIIDTSAKVGSYAPIMATMEACNGLEGDQILQSRLTAAAVDSVVARVYGKTLDYVRQKLHAEPEKRSFKNYLIDTATMIGVYTPVYAGILYAAGADSKQILGAITMGAGFAAVTARPYAKYILGPWRKKLGYKK
ncbi:MAG: L-alanine exporter AlaE [Candidatus Woesearchaeota archaeon]